MFKPTLAVAADLNNIRFPVYASPKLDGIRCSIVNGQALTRTLKSIPNKHISAALSLQEYSGFDGELIFGDPCSKSVYRDTNSAVMAHEGKPDMSYYTFDLHNVDDAFANRLSLLRQRIQSLPSLAEVRIVMLTQKLIQGNDDMLRYEEECLNLGYEGLILRSPNSPYKFGRSTVKEGYMLKVKRFVDSEAVIIGTEEEMFNGNEAEINELGRTKRSTAAGGLVGKGTMGALIVKDLTSGIEFKIGTGFDAADRAKEWPDGMIVKYKSFSIGVKDKPRHPVFLGIRDKSDL